jgi:hypothetical protein
MTEYLLLIFRPNELGGNVYHEVRADTYDEAERQAHILVRSYRTHEGWTLKRA